jgi:hypothetical protein
VQRVLRGTFRSGLKIEQASVTFNWSSYADFENACATGTNVPHR